MNEVHVDKSGDLYLVSISQKGADGKSFIRFYGYFTSLDGFKNFSEQVVAKWPQEDQK